MGLTGIILAGGKSRRMGTDKGLMLFNGRPMVTYSIALLEESCDRIIISTSNAEYRRFGFETVSDIYPDKGPLGGLYSSLKLSTSDINLCLPCDVPWLTSSVIKGLTGSADPFSCLVPLTPLPEPLIAVYPLKVAPVLEQMLLAGIFRMTAIYERFPTRYIAMDEFPAGITRKNFSNINSVSDLDESLE